MKNKYKKLTTLILILTLLLGTVLTVTADAGIGAEPTEIDDEPIPLGTLNNNSQLTGLILLLVIGGTMIIVAGIGLVFYRNSKNRHQQT